MGVSTSAIVRDATLLREWLEVKAGLALTPVTLAEDAPAHVRAFWENVGWNDCFERELSLVHPDAERGRVRALATLAGWREDDGRALPVEKLPSHFRMVVQDSSGESFTITDESTASDNPMLVGVVRDQRKKLVTIRERYLKRVSALLVQRALATMHRETVTVSLKHDKVVRGTPLLPALGTVLRQLDEGLILLGVRNDGAIRFLSVAFTEFEQLVEWMASLPGVRRMQAPLTGLRIDRDEETLRPVLDAMTDVKSARTVDEADWNTVLGRLDGHWMVLEQYERGWSAVVDPADRGVFAAMAARGCPLDLTPPPDSAPWRHPRAEGRAPSLKQIERVSETLAALLCELSPEHAATREPVEVDANVPAHVAVILRAVGRSSVIEGALPLAREASQARLRSILTRWFGAPLPRDVWQHVAGSDALAHLPERVRLLRYTREDRPQRIPLERIHYLDESDGVADPPVLCRRAGDYLPTEWDLRVSNTLVFDLIERAAGAGRASRWVRWTAMPAGAVPVFPRVCPSIFRVAAGVYGSPTAIYFVDDRAYGAWLAGLSNDDLGFCGVPDTYRRRRVTKGTKLKPSALDGQEGFRRFVPATANPASRAEYAFGLVDGWPVWVSHHPRDPVCLSTDTAALDAVRVWVDGHGGELEE